jgi:hypothetical protein
MPCKHVLFEEKEVTSAELEVTLETAEDDIGAR